MTVTWHEAACQKKLQTTEYLIWMSLKCFIAIQTTLFTTKSD
jgi:hypothetical protein